MSCNAFYSAAHCFHHPHQYAAFVDAEYTIAIKTALINGRQHRAYHCLWPSEMLAFLNQSEGMNKVLESYAGWSGLLLLASLSWSGARKGNLSVRVAKRAASEQSSMAPVPTNPPLVSSERPQSHDLRHVGFSTHHTQQLHNPVLCRETVAALA